jgi:hypothetical protein
MSRFDLRRDRAVIRLNFALRGQPEAYRPMVKEGTGMKTFPSNGSQTSRGENELASLSRKFQALIDSCPSWVSPRQKIMTE